MRVAEGYAHGAVDFLTTPVIPAVLQAKVRVFADLFRMTHQVHKQAEERIAYVEERTRREAAEETTSRLGFLAHTAELLGHSLDERVTISDVVRLPIPLLADTVALVNVGPDDRAGEFTLARTDSPAFEEGQGCQNLDPELCAVVSRLLSGDDLEVRTEDVVALPLRARGKTLAILGLSRAPSGRRFTPPDLALVETFASRAAIALENARLYREVQEADRQKNEFLSMLAHELRNPLAPIRNANEVLRHNVADQARVRWANGVIDRQVTHLVRLVDDLLDVSRLTLGKIRLAVETIALDSIISSAIEASRPLIDQFRHQLEVSTPPHPVRIEGDPTRLTQVLTNLLNNAAKYTPAGGRIWLAVEGFGPGESSPSPLASVTPHPSQTVVIRVRDNGIGIPPDLLPRIFDPFTQANRSLDRSQGGLGIGLTLVRRLVEMHDGSVEAHSEGPGCGSEFVLRLPAIPEPLPAHRTQSSERKLGKIADSLRVVVVDDNLDGAESLAELLSVVGHQVQVAHDGPTGIATITAYRPDVVLLDIGLPGMDGFEVARQLRRNPDLRTVLIAISGYGRDEDFVRSREAGFDHHFVKPVEFKALLILLSSLNS